MTVYADVVFAVNTVVNYLLLLLGARLTGFPARPLRSLLAAAVGGGYAVCVLLPALAFMGTWWGKTACFVLMCMSAYGFRRKAFRTGITTLLCGGALAGFVFLLTQVFSVGIVVFGGHVYYPLASKVLILLAGCFYLAAALLMAGTMKHGSRELLPLQLRIGENCVTVRALLDTGHTLVDPISGKPVVVLEWQTGAELLGVRATEAMFQDPTTGLDALNKAVPACRLRLVPYRCIGKNSGMLLAAPCRVKAGKRRETAALAALSPNPVSDGGNYEALIGGAFV